MTLKNEQELLSRLREIQSEVQDMQAKLDPMHDALFKVPPSQPSDTPPLIETLRIIARSWVRGNWVLRASFRSVMLLAAVGAAVGTLAGWWKGVFKP